MARKKNDVAGVYEKYPSSGIWYIRARTADVNLRKRIGTREEAEKALALIQLARMTGHPLWDADKFIAILCISCKVVHGRGGAR